MVYSREARPLTCLMIDSFCLSTCVAAFTWAGCCRVECCTRCLAQGVTATHIIDGRQQHSLLMEMLTDEGTLMSPHAIMH